MHLHSFDTENKTKAQVLTVSALFVVVLAVCSWISIPLPGTPVPVNLGTFGVILTALYLGRRTGISVVLVFLLAGGVGLPLFQGFSGGMAALAGPTGGFLVGYVLLAFFVSGSRDTVLSYALHVLAGEAALYATGVVWFMILTGSALLPALGLCVFPFLPGDVLKAILAYGIWKKLPRI